MAQSPEASADTVRAVARTGDFIRAVQVRREGGEVLIPLFAAGSLLGAEARWDPATNRWSLRSRSVGAVGYLDEPLVLVNGQPLLVRQPPRLVARQPYLSLEAMRILGRHGWDAEVAWNEATRELLVRPAQAGGAAPTTGRVRPATVPSIPPGARVVALDPGHAPGEGIHGLRGLDEGGLGLRLALAVAATLAADGLVPVVVREGGADADPRDVAGLANALPADLFVGFHASEWGEPGAALWTYGLVNLLGTGLTFEPFEPPGGWARDALSTAPRSAAVARRLVAALASAHVPARGPLAAPLAGLEGLACPAVALEVEGLATPEGLALVRDDTALRTLAELVAGALRAELKAAAGTAP